MNTLELTALCKSYGNLPAADHINLSVATGSRTAIVGPSGSGKTTLLRMIAGFDMPDSGRITLDGDIMADSNIAVPAHQRRIGYVPQDGALFPHLSIADNIGFGLSGSADSKLPQVQALMEMVSLDQRMLKRWPHELSGGQQQRVALARALAQRPRLMLLDEPFSALDTGLRVAMRKAVAQVLAEAGVTTILVTHDQAEALSFADQLAVMRQGRLVQAGSPMELYLRPNDAATAQFLGDAVILPARLAHGVAHCELGSIAVNSQQQGDAQIMLRPEQLQLSAANGHDDACRATVTDSDFGGSSCVLTVALNTAQARTLLVRCSSLSAPQVGHTVRLSVNGMAHVLA